MPFPSPLHSFPHQAHFRLDYCNVQYQPVFEHSAVPVDEIPSSNQIVVTQRHNFTSEYPKEVICLHVLLCPSFMAD